MAPRSGDERPECVAVQIEQPDAYPDHSSAAVGLLDRGLGDGCLGSSRVDMQHRVVVGLRTTKTAPPTWNAGNRKCVPSS
ncbi:MAG TPA: hypothetical protein VES21_02820, partial [Nocardioidaceae bacterium]|nr:hypothetical protein [Nocardioidaceae bacterium]